MHVSCPAFSYPAPLSAEPAALEESAAAGQSGAALVQDADGLLVKLQLEWTKPSP